MGCHAKWWPISLLAGDVCKDCKAVTMSQFDMVGRVQGKYSRALA